MDKEKRHIVLMVDLAVTDLSEPVLMVLPAVAQGLEQAVHLDTEDVLMVKGAADNATKVSLIVHGSPRTATVTMASENITMELTGLETRKVDTIGEEISLVTVPTLTWSIFTDLLEN